MTTIKTGNRRLLRLADKLEGKGVYEKDGPVPRHKFDLHYWFSEKFGGKSAEPSDFNPKRCKTAACAVGWALSDPWFRRAGLVRVLDNEEVFHLTSNEFHHLFMGDFYPTPRPRPTTVAKRIRKFVASREAA